MEEIWKSEVGRKLAKGLEKYPVQYSIGYLLFFGFTLATFFGFVSYFVLVFFYNALGVLGASATIWTIAIFMSIVFLGINSLYVFTFPTFLKEIYGRYVNLGNRSLFFAVLYFESIIFFALSYCTLENSVGGQFSYNYDFVSIYFERLPGFNDQVSGSNSALDVMGGKISLSFSAGFESFLNALYFSLITQTTIGYGDISPVSGLAKLFSALQGISTFIIVVFLIGRRQNTLPNKHSPIKTKIHSPKNRKLSHDQKKRRMVRRSRR